MNHDHTGPRATRGRACWPVLAALTIATAPVEAGSFCRQVDLNGCGCVNAQTLALLLSQWGDPGAPADFNGDGDVDGFDLGYLLAHWTGTFDAGPCLDIPRQPTEVELVVVEDTDPDTAALGWREFAVSVPFASADAMLLNVFDANLALSGADTWVQNDLFADDGDATTWYPVPQLGADPCSCDSYVTIGVAPGFGSPVSADPNLAGADPDALDTNVGWFAVPSAGVGLAGAWPDNTVLILHLVTPAAATTSGELSFLARDGDTLLYGHATFTAGGIPGDLNGDGAVDGSDLGLLLGAWNGAGLGDLNHSGNVDGADLGLLLAAWTG